MVGFRLRCRNRRAGDRVNLAETWIGCMGGMGDIMELRRNKAMIKVRSNLNNSIRWGDRVWDGLVQREGQVQLT